MYMPRNLEELGISGSVFVSWLSLSQVPTKTATSSLYFKTDILLGLFGGGEFSITPIPAGNIDR